jgi:RimJ/RimL family protein N-acetyltransferase
MSVPKDNKVEIHFDTFPEYEGRGIATAMVKMLVDMVKRVDPTLKIVATTPPIKGATTTVLEKNGFILDKEGKKSWRWNI